MNTLKKKRWHFGTQIFYFASALLCASCNENSVLDDHGFIPIEIMGGVEEMPCLAGPNCKPFSPNENTPPNEPLDVPETDCSASQYSKRISFAALLSNYSNVSTVSLLDQCGRVLPCLKDVVHSNSRALSNRSVGAAIGGDVVLPTMAPGQGKLLVIDRGTSVITELNLEDGSFIQTLGYPPETVANETPSVNVHDAMPLSADTYLFSRHDVHGSEGCTLHGRGCEHGNDLLFASKGNRPFANLETHLPFHEISMGEWIEFKQIERYTDAGIEVTEVPIFPRPSKILYLENLQLFAVGLAFLDGSFTLTRNGSFALVGWDWQTEQWQKQLFPITEPGTDEESRLANCGNITPLPGDSSRFLIQCGGEINSFSEVRRSRAGIALIHVQTDFGQPNEFQVTTEAMWRARNHREVLPPYTDGMTSLSGPHVVVPANPNFHYAENQQSEPDQLLYINLETGQTEIIFTADGSQSPLPNYFALRSTMYNPETHILLVADATQGMHRFQVHWENSLPSFEHLDTISHSQLSTLNQSVRNSHAIPVRQISPLSSVLLALDSCF